MFHFTPTPSLHSRFPASAYHSAQPLSPRDRYLAALAEAKAAEAEYLAADAAQREEERLLRQLEQVKLQRKLDEELFLRSEHDSIPSYDPYTTWRFPLSSPDLPFQSFMGDRPDFEYDRPALTRRQFEAEERVRIGAAYRQREQRRQQSEEARILLTFKRQKEEEQRKALFLRRQQEEQQRRVLALRKCQQAKAIQSSAEEDPQHILRLLFGNTSEATVAHKEHNALPKHCCRSRRESRHKREADVDLDQFLQAIFGQQAAGTNKQQKHSTQAERHVVEQPVDIQQLLSHIFEKQVEVAEKEQQPDTSASSQPKPEPCLPDGDGLQKILNLFVGGEANHASQPQKEKDSAPQASSPHPTATEGEGLQPLNGGKSEKSLDNRKGKATQPSACRSKSQARHPEEGLQAILNLVLGGHPGVRVQKWEPEQLQVRAQPATAAQPASTVTSLKQDLETRLNNDPSVDVRDTIQAILASLATPSASAPTPASALDHSQASVTDKGKAKEVSFAPTVVTSKDVVQSMNTVRNIEAAFFALESDFVFPSQLDFTPTLSLASSDSESSTSRLAFTSRNQPIRFYEQALSALLGQLDSVESFGNEELRGRRKEVVGRVEKALEELESGVEGRWRLKIGKGVSTQAEAMDPRMVNAPAVEPTQTEPARSSAVPTSSEEPSIHEYVEVTIASSPHDAEPAAEPAAVAEAVGTTTGEVLASVIVEGESDEHRPPTPADNSADTPSKLVSISTPSDFENSSAAEGYQDAVSIDGDEIPASQLFVDVTEQPPRPDYTKSDSRPSSPTASSSVVTTIRPYVTPVPKTEPEPVDTFLLPASSEASSEPKLKVAMADEWPKGDHDAGSDWSEVEA